jgi:hypothetical protein
MTQMTGGCQCGAVRYALHAAPTSSTLCHCRMCQKAMGGPFMVSANVKLGAWQVVRGSLAIFRSSSVAERGFCAACGTPLTFRYVDQDRISVTLGSLDDPNAVAPGEQIGTEARVTWWRGIETLPEKTTQQDAPDLTLENFQHPDRPT